MRPPFVVGGGNLARPSPSELWPFEHNELEVASAAFERPDIARARHPAVGTGRPLSAAGIAELLRNPLCNGYLVRYPDFSDEERVEAPWRRRRDEDGDVIDPPVSDDLWERVQTIRAERSTPGTRAARDRIYVPRLVCLGCGLALYGHVLGPVIVEAKVADDLLVGKSLVLAPAPERAELTGEKAAVMHQLIGGRRSRLIRSDTAEARKKRHQRSPEGTSRCIGRGERARPFATRQIRGCRVTVGGHQGPVDLFLSA